jgi:hypothetical protein
MVSKYDGLGAYLRQQTASEVPMTFADIERVTGVSLPEKSQHSRAWWSNNPGNNVMTKVWLDAGFETAQVDMKAKTVVFARKAHRHPAWGALKDTFQILPRSAASPEPLFRGGVFTDEEWDEIEEEMQKDWDQIAEGMTGMSEHARDYTPPEPEKPMGRHPAWGALKGVFQIDPSWDLTKPTMSEEELDEMDANLDCTADRIDAGTSRKK